MGSSRIHVGKRNRSLSDIQSEFSHIYRKKTLWELIRIATAVVGIEFTYSAITSFVTPILSEMGIGYDSMSVVWAISPLIGLFLSPLLGSMSDRCTLGLGRRRPFIIFFAIFNVIGLLLIPFGEILSNDASSNSFYYSVAVFVTILGVVIADYTSDALQSPSRAYLLDLCQPADQARGLTTLTIMGGIGGFFGYLLGTFDWTNTTVYDNAFHENAFSGHVHMFFTLSSVLFAICILISVTTLKEMPLRVIEHLKLTSSISIANEEREVGDKIFQGISSILEEKVYGTIEKQPSFSIRKEHPTLKNYLLSIFDMPRSLRVLCITNLFCWMAHSSYTLYFTDFVGTVVYGGNSTVCLILPCKVIFSLFYIIFSHFSLGMNAPKADDGTTDRTLYEDGVKFGCLGMSLFSLSCTCYSIIIEKLIKKFSLKPVYMGGILIDSVCLFFMVMLRSKIAVILFSIGCGILYSTMFTVPYILLVHYHEINVFELDEFGGSVLNKEIRGLGTDISVIGSCIFIAQFLLSILASIVMHFTKSSSDVLLIGSFLGFVAFLCATRVIYLEM